jgi:hypothetical protein
VIAVGTGTIITNDTPPVANNDSYSVVQDQTLTIQASGVLGNDTDINGDPLTAVLVGSPSHGTLTLHSDGSFTYSPAIGYVGTVHFTYQAFDGTLLSNIATVSITVTPNGPLSNDSGLATGSNPTPTAASGSLDSRYQLLQAMLGSLSSNGTLMLNRYGSFTYVPSSAFLNVDRFPHLSFDGLGRNSGHHGHRGPRQHPRNAQAAQGTFIMLAMSNYLFAKL